MNVSIEAKTSCGIERFLVQEVLETLIASGVTDYVICPAGRCAPFVYPLANAAHLRTYYWSEERSAAFFALGRIKATGRPVAVITTSGTAAAETIPATMEAYYSGLPLILITADRPRRFRGSGAPQSAEQVGIFSYYVEETIDLEENETVSLSNWSRLAPLHLNICLEEPKDEICQSIRLSEEKKCSFWIPPTYPMFDPMDYLHFLEHTHSPLVVVGALKKEDREKAVQFLKYFGAPVYIEAPSGIREDDRLASISLRNPPNFLEGKIDGVLRLGSIPTHRLWRDLEGLEGEIRVCSVSDLPFSGLSWGTVNYCGLHSFFDYALSVASRRSYTFSDLMEVDQIKQSYLLELFKKKPQGEQSLIHRLSEKIPRGSLVYLGNSMPIREWDLGATEESKDFEIIVNRGVNGIDGQISTFLGSCTPSRENWAIIGDLTALYDFAALWVTPQMVDISATLVIINNGGGKIFKGMFAHSAFQNQHSLSFEPFAKFWGWHYERWESVPSVIISSKGMRLIELVPDEEVTDCLKGF